MDKMREEFESWFSAENVALPQRAGDGGYHYTPANDMWIAWKASRAALCVKLPCSWYQDREGYILNREDDVKSCLDDAGVRYE